MRFKKDFQMKMQMQKEKIKFLSYMIKVYYMKVTYKKIFVFYTNSNHDNAPL